MSGYPGADHRVIPTGTGGAARQAMRLVAVGLLAGLLLGAAPLQQWTETLPPGLAWAGRAAAGWQSVTARIGLDRPYDALRTLSRELAGP